MSLIFGQADYIFSLLLASKRVYFDFWPMQVTIVLGPEITTGTATKFKAKQLRQTSREDILCDYRKEATGEGATAAGGSQSNERQKQSTERS